MPNKLLKNIAYKYIIPPIAFTLIYLVSFTVKIKVLNRSGEEGIDQKGGNKILSFWHGRFFILPYIYRRDKRYSILVSPSLDGEIISRTLSLFGFSIIRGSSFKGGREAFWKIIRAAKKKRDHVVMIADGSRGPAYKLQSGAIYIAKSSDIPIIPVSFNARKKKILPTWDSFIIPYPFTDVILIYGDPIYIKKEDDIEIKRKEVEDILLKITEEADRYF